MAEQPEYSLWIRPYGDLAYKLQDRINKLSETYNTPTFEPHLTLLGGLQASESELNNVTDMLAHSLNPFSIELTEVDTGGSYFHCIYIKAKRTSELLHAHEHAAKVFEVEPDTKQFDPHVSLMYGDFDMHEKERILNKMSRSYDTSFTARNLLIVKTSGSPEQWEKQHSVDITS